MNRHTGKQRQKPLVHGPKKTLQITHRWKKGRESRSLGELSREQWVKWIAGHTKNKSTPLPARPPLSKTPTKKWGWGAGRTWPEADNPIPGLDSHIGDQIASRPQVEPANITFYLLLAPSSHTHLCCHPAHLSLPPCRGTHLKHLLGFSMLSQPPPTYAFLLGSGQHWILIQGPAPRTLEAPPRSNWDLPPSSDRTSALTKSS
jgi:hypothetical protein